MKKIAVSLIISVMMVFGMVGSAAAVSTSTKSVLPLKAQQNILDEIKQKAGMTKEEFEAKRMEIKNSMEQKQKEFRNNIEAKREQLKSQIETKRTELKTRLAKIKDENKKQIVERVYNQVNELNKRLTDHFLNVLEKLEKVLERISSRAAKAEVNGRDISVVKIVITEATNAIASTTIAIQNQAAKVYAPTINTENTLKIDVGKIRQALHTDLVAVRETVKNVQEAVQKAAVALAQIPKVDELEIPTSQQGTTTQPTP